MALRPARSAIFVPGNRPERFDKAFASGAHQVILDLEDAVAPTGKDEARAQVAAWLGRGGTAVVRINAPDTDWYEADLEMLQRYPAAHVMLPKVNRAAAAHATSALPGRPLIGLVETVTGCLELAAICSTAGVVRLAFGSVDFAADSGMVDEEDAMTPVRVQVVLQSRAAGLAAPLDGVSVDFRNFESMERDVKRSRRLGFGGKLCIHPAQVLAVNDGFMPTPAEVDWARRVLEAFENSEGEATAVDGKMIDRPVVERARRILAEGGERGAA